MKYDVVLQLTVELTTASSYLGQGAGLSFGGGGEITPMPITYLWGVISKFRSLHFISMVSQE